MTMQPVRQWVAVSPSFYPQLRREFPVWTRHGHMGKDLNLSPTDVTQNSPTSDSNLAMAAAAVQNAGNLCQVGPDGMNGTVLAFEVAWNVTNDPNMGSPKLTEDGKYGHDNVQAMLRATGGAVIPAACTSYTGGGSSAPSPFGSPSGAPGSSTSSAAWPWWKILLLAMLGGGAGYLAYKGLQKHKEGGGLGVRSYGEHGGYAGSKYARARQTVGEFARATYHEFQRGAAPGAGASAHHGKPSKALIAGGVGVAALIGFLIYEKQAHAAPKVLPPTRCPDGSPAPGGIVGNCPPPSMGNNDPDAPPGGWVYNAPVAPAPTIQQTAAALAALDPCDPKNAQAVRNFQAAAGLAQINGGPGWDQVNPPGTDGRYGGDTAKALATYVQNAPAPCYSNAHPQRPGWWGPVGTYTNPAANA